MNLIVAYCTERAPFRKGDIIDCLDPVGRWYVSEVKEIRVIRPGTADEESSMRVHYGGWSVTWDEFIPVSSYRLGFANSHDGTWAFQVNDPADVYHLSRKKWMTGTVAYVVPQLGGMIHYYNVLIVEPNGDREVLLGQQQSLTISEYWPIYPWRSTEPEPELALGTLKFIVPILAPKGTFTSSPC